MARRGRPQPNCIERPFLKLVRYVDSITLPTQAKLCALFLIFLNVVDVWGPAFNYSKNFGLKGNETTNETQSEIQVRILVRMTIIAHFAFTALDIFVNLLLIYGAWKNKAGPVYTWMYYNGFMGCFFFVHFLTLVILDRAFQIRNLDMWFPSIYVGLVRLYFLAAVVDGYRKYYFVPGGNTIHREPNDDLSALPRVTIRFEKGSQEEIPVIQFQ